MTEKLTRRGFLKAAGVAGAATALPTGVAAQDASAQPADQGVLFFFNDEEARVMEALIDRLIPADPDWPGAVWAGVLTFIDRQLAGAYGAGEKMYLAGPWDPDAPTTQGYQLRFTPAELYRIGIRDLREHVRQAHGGAEPWDLGPDVLDELLKGLENGDIGLPSLPTPVFFETLLANTIEGWFADPAYGGNRDMVAWRMIGFPGAYAQYVDLVEEYDLVYTRPPISMGDQAARHTHVGPHEGEEHGR